MVRTLFPVLTILTFVAAGVASPVVSQPAAAAGLCPQGTAALATTAPGCKVAPRLAVPARSAAQTDADSFDCSELVQWAASHPVAAVAPLGSLSGRPASTAAADAAGGRC